MLVYKDVTLAAFFEGLPVDIVRADILDPLALMDAFRGAETVFH